MRIDPGTRRRFGRNGLGVLRRIDRKSTRLNSSHQIISYAVFCLKKKTNNTTSKCVGWMSTNENISVVTPPVVTTQTVPVLVAANATACFIVTASVNVLSYLWFQK